MAPVKVMVAGGGPAKPKRKKKSTSSSSAQKLSTPTKAQNRAEEEDHPSASAVTANLLELESPSADEKARGAAAAAVSPRKPVKSTTVEQHDTSAATSDVDGYNDSSLSPSHVQYLWLFICFLGIMISFVCYGLLLEYATSGGRKLHELSFLFVTSGLYTLTAAAGRYVRDEEPTSIPPARFAVLGLTSMGSTFCSVRSLRYVIFPIQVLAKSCKPVPVMLMGALMGKSYPMRKYINVCMIVAGVALFMGGGDSKKKQPDEEQSSASQMIGLLLLFVSLCFDGGTGAYEDKLMAVHHVGPFDLMYNIQLGKTILAGVGLLVLNQVHIFIQLCQDMGFLLVALGLSGAMGQVFIFITIAKFGALTCSIIGLARKVTTLVASILFYGHSLNGVQCSGLVVAVSAMVLNFWGKKGGKGGHGHGGGGHGSGPSAPAKEEEMQKFLDSPPAETQEDGDVEMAKQQK
uniref:Sugar phosphate transporter domain-containing protein n=1 Tax=Grammatophora oceanica TaxID=210454 RepID=A0A7S1Y487_9STRA|mmetsp:Transcript_18664/g.27691  ORF Transcript_18664/g.27691 Transcript_18664/m.27691 type:complete len:461 (+) Transcript_18664:81-1463(+)|eukprot:CAMPEP_0194030278 /NCGR_PEP_ID=MMETSP0009_2-20130614/3828_1 /TAXON_ID=210454 /ORGANISM="Grammatophora oceanica, Strain CCMP 410" /LENGTH=460 /DNA_ID=CAMNT_0038670201 /DNA_START=76 /DNA_END=1458 /DNA_ORIENTATION=+